MAKIRWTPIPPGEMILCGFGDSYQTRRDQGSSDFELLYTLNGRGRFACADRSPAFISTPGDLALLRPGAVHDYGPEGDDGWRWIWVHFHAPDAWLPLLDWPERGPGIHHLRPDDGEMARRLKRRLLEVEHLARGPWTRRGWLAMNALEEVLLWCDNHLAGAGGQRADPRIRLILNRLSQDLESPCRRDELARLAGLSVSRLSALFRREVGTGISQYRDRLRLTRAAELLRATSEQVQRIGQSVGYDNPFHFSIRFKAFTGCSPREWRRTR